MSTDTKFQLERVRAPVSDEELVADMRRVAELVATNAVSFRLYSKSGRYHPSTVALRFGTWNEALVAAGLTITSERDIADERLFENLMRLWEHYGRQPRFRDLARPPSVISSGPYQRRFRSWMNALEQFVAYANAQDMRPPLPVEAASAHNTGRDPSLRLRFRVMKRDNFSCRACGASPAFKPGLSLHVDHIKAWSLGGETVEENLQTLCEPCNLGKSNVL
jgi:HNH endonuclease/Homing endonuclease associated repeat